MSRGVVINPISPGVGSDCAKTIQSCISRFPANFDIDQRRSRGKRIDTPEFFLVGLVLKSSIGFVADEVANKIAVVTVSEEIDPDSSDVPAGEERVA